MDARPLLAEAAALFGSRLMAERGCTSLPLPVIAPPRDWTPGDFTPGDCTPGDCTPGDQLPGDQPPGGRARGMGLRWDNLLLSSHRFRRAHVETFDVPERLYVLHVCVFPSLRDTTPIFGFDVVAGPSRVTGIFLDLSPVVRTPPILRLRDVVHAEVLTQFAVRRPPPEWGDIFSADLLAIRPVDLGEVRLAIEIAQQALAAMLAAPQRSGETEGEVADGQARYIMGQRRNEHTLRLLAGFIGPAAARRFIDQVLFPSLTEPPLPDPPLPNTPLPNPPLPDPPLHGVSSADMSSTRLCRHRTEELQRMA